MKRKSRVSSEVEVQSAEAVPEGAVPYGVVYTDGELDDVRSVDRQGVEALWGVPAVNWRGLEDGPGYNTDGVLGDDVVVSAPKLSKSKK